MSCPSCNQTDHRRSSSKLCPNYNPRQNKKAPDKDLVKGDEKVYKIGFASLCRKPHRNILLARISNCVRQCSQIAFEASSLLNLHLLRLLENDQPLPENLLNLTFLRQFFSVVKTTHRQNIDHDVDLTFRQNYLPCRHSNFQTADGKHCSQMITYLVKEYAVNLDLHIKSHFENLFRQKLTRVFKDKWNLPRYERNSIIRSIVSSDEQFLEDNPHMREFVDEYKVHSSTLMSKLRFNQRENLLVYRLNLDSFCQNKCYNLVPLYTLKSKYITLDCDALYQVCGNLSVFTDHRSNKKEFGLAQEWVFSKLFRIPKRFFQHAQDKRTFNFMIKTDGVGASVVLSRWKAKDREIIDAPSIEEKAKIYKARQELKRKNELRALRIVAQDERSCWIGIDPGRKDVMTTYKENDGTFRNFSNARYYTESNFKQRIQKAKLYATQEGLLKWSLGTPSLKYGTSHSMRIYLGYVLSDNFEKMLDMVNTKKYKKLRWRCYIHNQKTIYEFCKEILQDCKPEKTVVCFGDASFRHNSAGYASSPKQGMFKVRAARAR